MILLNLCVVAILCCASGYADKCTPTFQLPDRNSGCCGVATYDLKKIPGFYAALDQYPWAAIVEYKKGDQILLQCSAVLISGRYALSAAQCYTVDAERVGTPINVRLGDYNITNDGPDCIEEAEGKYCNDGALKIPIEKIIVHPGFQRNARNREHDIALIKLKETAPYTDFVRPICLPATDVTLEPRRYMHAGWGAVNISGSLSDILHHVDLPFVDAATCVSAFGNSRFSAVGNGQFCAGGEEKDTCIGDSGGPLMYENDHKFELAGIVSFGRSLCGLNGKPGVYTKVFTYMDWIRENIVE